MAILGAQLVITLIMVSVMQKIGKHFSFSRWLLSSTGLTRSLYPTDDELKTLAGIPKEKSKGKRDKKHFENGRTSNTFHIPRNLDIQLENAKVCVQDLVHLRYYAEYQWLLDFSIYSLIVYGITEVYTYYIPIRDEINLSMLWCFLVIVFTLKILLQLTFQYFYGTESIGERSTVIVTWFAYLLVAMAILLIDEGTLETGLEKAYTSFNSSAYVFLEKHGLQSQGPASKLILKFFLALWCATIGALFTFPGFRMARMHWDALRYCKERRIMTVILNLSFIAPFILILLWLRPVSKHYLTVRIFTGMTAPLLTEPMFDSLRLILVILAVVNKFILMPIYLQAYLNIADTRLQEQKKEAGRITNIDLQKKIAVVFYYMCVVALQYIAPLLMCLFFTITYKSLGDYSWGAFFGLHPTDECSASEAPSKPLPFGDEDSVLKSAQEISLALDSLKQVMTTEVCRGVLGFATWWTCFSWFASSSLGLIYQSYFTHT